MVALKCFPDHMCVSEHYKYMFLVARDLYEMFVLYRGKHTTRRSMVGI